MVEVQGIKVESLEQRKDSWKVEFKQKGKIQIPGRDTIDVENGTVMWVPEEEVVM